MYADPFDAFEDPLHPDMPPGTDIMTANGGKAMMPLHHLLNPSGVQAAQSPYHYGPIMPPSSSTSKQPVATSANFGPRFSHTDDGRDEMTAILSKARPRGHVNYPPFEDLDAHSMQEVARFQVTPFGQIHKGFQHIPYSSSKKDLFDKTGRESIEAFKYEFRVPGSDRTYVVMWDYNIGIVRMNPFIKWGGFPKTKSSQMLDKNPGLRSISPGITGGSVTAQGYWVPYRCAKALCASFCYPIAGALIPLFGPDFPSECIPPESSNYSEMIINRALLVEDARQAEHTRQYYTTKNHEARNDPTHHQRLMSGPVRAFGEPLGYLGQGHAQTVSHRPRFHPGAEHQYIISHGHGEDVSRHVHMHGHRIPHTSGTHFVPVNQPHSGTMRFEDANPYLTSVSHSSAREGRPETFKGPIVVKRRRLNQPVLQDSNRYRPHEGKPSSHSEQVEHNGINQGHHDAVETQSRSLAHYNAAMVLANMGSTESGSTSEEEQAASEDADSATVSKSLPIPSFCPVKRPRAMSI